METKPETRILTETHVLRYLPAQRLTHWLGALGFVILFFTGLVLVWSPLSFLAAGGYSRLLHRAGAVLMILWPILYLILNPHGFKEMVVESFHYSRDDLEWFKKAPGYFFGHAHAMPPQGRINAGQKVHHALVVLGLNAITLTGLVLWFGKGNLGGTWLALTAMLHDLSMLLLTVLLVGHLYFTLLYDALPAMLTGYVSEAYARMEHARWFAALPKQAPYVVGGRTAAPPAEISSAPDPVKKK